jgi:predicted neuraminidase
MLKEFIFKEFSGFKSCHAATIARMGNGELLTVWFAGTHEGNDDVAIWGSHRSGNRWQQPRKLAKVSQEPHWNPVLFNDGTGKLHLFFKVGRTIPDWRTWHMVSQNNGRSWQKPEEMITGDDLGGRGPVKNKPIILENGNIIAPGSVEKTNLWQAFADWSDDGGATWTRSNLISLPNPRKNGQGVIQPTLWESVPGRVHMLLRSSCGKVCRSDSTDGGRSWNDAYPISLPNNSSGLDLVKLPDGSLVLICNPTSDSSFRTPLSIMVSSDNGERWQKFCDIEDDYVKVGDIVKHDGGEFSYPSIIYSEEKVTAVYTWHRRRIAFWEAKVSELSCLLSAQAVFAG